MIYLIRHGLAEPFLMEELAAIVKDVEATHALPRKDVFALAMVPELENRLYLYSLTQAGATESARREIHKKDQKVAEFCDWHTLPFSRWNFWGIPVIASKLLVREEVQREKEAVHVLVVL